MKQEEKYELLKPEKEISPKDKNKWSRFRVREKAGIHSIGVEFFLERESGSLSIQSRKKASRR